MLSEAEINQIKDALRPMIVEEFSFRINEAIKDQILQEMIAGLDRIVEKLDSSFERFSKKISSELSVSWTQTNDLLGNIHGRQEKLIEGQDRIVTSIDTLSTKIDTLSSNVVGSVDQLSTKIDTLSKVLINEFAKKDQS